MVDLIKNIESVLNLVKRVTVLWIYTNTSFFFFYKHFLFLEINTELFKGQRLQCIQCT